MSVTESLATYALSFPLPQETPQLCARRSLEYRAGVFPYERDSTQGARGTPSTAFGVRENRHERVEFRDRFPAQQPAALFRVAAAVGDFGCAKECGVDVDVVLPV